MADTNELQGQIVAMQHAFGAIFVVLEPRQKEAVGATLLATLRQAQRTQGATKAERAVLESAVEALSILAALALDKGPDGPPPGGSEPTPLQ